MQVFRLAAIICLLATLSFAQNVIDTRGKAYREISGHLARGNGIEVGRALKILSGLFTIADPTNLTPGSRFDYELLVTNDSDASIMIPQTLDWKEIDEAHARQSFVRADLFVNMGCLNNFSDELDHVVLYGSDQRPGTGITLNLGESARILGSGLIPLHPNMKCQSKGTATFLVSFQVNTMTLQRTPKPAMRDGYTVDEQLFAIANAKGIPNLVSAVGSRMLQLRTLSLRPTASHDRNFEPAERRHGPAPGSRGLLTTWRFHTRNRISSFLVFPTPVS